jgi:hypothetical protein
MIPASAHDRVLRFGFGFGAGQAVLALALSFPVWLSCPDGNGAVAANRPQPAENTRSNERPENVQPSAEPEHSPDDEAEDERQIRPALYVPANDGRVHRIGATAVVTEVTTGLPFPARVDTGATTCAIHYEELRIEDPADNPEMNVGKQVSILVKNPDGEKEWISTKIVDHVTVRTTTDDDDRYKVQLKLRWQDLEKKVLVTLSDREKMKYPLLLGRNFLRGDFLVDVELDGEK